jgi:hypothetical protein
MGLMLVAIVAGINPINVPKMINNATATKTIGIFTVGFTNTA